MAFHIGVAGQRPPPGGVLASSTTTALAGLTRGLAVDLAPVRVNAICAGLVGNNHGFQSIQVFDD